MKEARKKTKSKLRGAERTTWMGTGVRRGNSLKGGAEGQGSDARLPKKSWTKVPHAEKKNGAARGGMGAKRIQWKSAGGENGQ